MLSTGHERRLDALRDTYRRAAIVALAIVGSMAIASRVNAQANGRPGVAPPPSVYADANDYGDAARVAEANAVNGGGVTLDLSFRYLTDYVFRGLDQSEGGGHEDAPNLQFDTAIGFDLAKAPHPYLGVFANVYNADPISRFQEIRPFFGADWTIRPLILGAGHNTYLYPERDDLNTSEFFVRFALDDSYWLKTERPVFSPYLYSAYDYDKYKGWYFETGVEHTFEFPDWGMDLQTFADVAYVTTNERFAVVPGGTDSGFQHFDLGLTLRYSLNTLAKLPPRFGTWRIEGYLVYTDGIANELRADTQTWGGLGLHFTY